MTSWIESADVVVVGAGIVGLAHAHAAWERGLSVAVVERDDRATGASVRNFGHGCVTAQDGIPLEYGLVARETWLRLAGAAGFRVSTAGTVVVARGDEEHAVLEEFRDLRDGQVALLDVAAVAERVAVGPEVVGGALLPLDIRVDPREAAHSIAAWLAERGVRFHWGTAVHAVEPGLLGTSRGSIRAGKVVVAVGHDVDRHFPDLAEAAGVRRCALRMLRVVDPHGRRVDAAVLTGHSMLRYDGFAACASLPALRDRLTADRPDLVDIGLNLMFTQAPTGELTIGDTHHYGRTLDPYDDEALDAAVLAETARLLGVPGLTVLQRWRGVYASAPDPFLVATPFDGVRVVSVTSGIGMTTAFGLAPRVLETLLA